MSRKYIDEKDVYRLVEPTGVARVHCSQIDELPRADVVSKSDVDLYRKQVDELEDELASTYDKLEKARAEVAREIFEEIEEQIAFFRMYRFLSNGVNAIVKVLDELKKKYTESEKDNG